VHGVYKSGNVKTVDTWMQQVEWVFEEAFSREKSIASMFSRSNRDASGQYHDVGKSGFVIKQGAGIREQMEELDSLEITYEVIPGVSSFVAGAAAVKREFTVPGISQTVICTRMEGRTPVPKLEQIELLASHKTSMSIFLSVGMMEELVKRLMVHYDKQTPVAVIEKASWPDERIIEANLETIADKVKEAGITKTAMILVGDFLGDRFENSKLYDADFSHEYRSKLKK